MGFRLLSSTHPRWFEASSADLPALLSDHLHCERKAAENALSLVRRYPHRGASVEKLGRLAHEETSHVVQVGALLGRRGWTARADSPNRYARALLAEVRSREPGRLFDALLVGAFIEARSHERLGLLARGFARIGDGELADFYEALATAEERHAEIFIELARPLLPEADGDARISELAELETEILAALPHASRIH
jgi:tRNA 2-(methylsulfanyl)-N6-isopentenyladenosine37 hydroxylase